jgi:hypothetical protein
LAEIAFNLETVKHPPFENDPPVKFNIPAKTIGLVYCIIGAILLVFAGLGALLTLVFGGIGTAINVTNGGSPVGFIIRLVSIVIAVVAYAMIAWGGYRMYQLDHGGRDMVLLGIFALVVSGFIGAFGSLSVLIVAGLIFWAISTAVTFIFYYLIVISRFPDEAPLVAGGGSNAGAPPPSA